MALKIDKALPDSFANAEVLSLKEEKVPIKSLYTERPTLLVFIRHFGCIGCTTQMLALEPHLVELDSLGLSINIIGNGQFQYLEGFVEKFKLQGKPVQLFTDPTLNAYKQAQLTRSVWQALGPRTWLDYLRAFSKGIGQTSIQGDNLQLGGTMLVNTEGLLKFYFQNASVADHADLNTLISTVHKFVLSNNPNIV